MSNKFCNTHHLFFKKNLDILNNKDNEIKFYRTLYTLNKDKIELLNKIFLEKITKNWVYIENYLKNLRKIVKVVKSSGNLKDFEIELDYNIHEYITNSEVELKHTKTKVEITYPHDPIRSKDMAWFMESIFYARRRSYGKNYLKTI